jgi:hypothetical protein
MARAVDGRATTSETSAVAEGFSNARAAPTSATSVRMPALFSQRPRMAKVRAAAAVACTI